MKSGILAIIAVCAAAWLVTEANAASPLDDLIEPKVGASACFTRAYDAAHLKANPKQRTTFIAAWLQYEKVEGATGMALGFSFAIRRRGEAEALFSQGGCDWDKQANRDTSNNRLIAAFRKDEGGVCLQSAQPDVFEAVSAEEGGSLIIDRKDKNTLMVYLDDSLTMVKRANRAYQINVEFGPDDRVFMLRRAPAKDCDFIEEAVMTPEPGVRDRRQR